MSTTNINICIDSEIKNQAQDVFASLGLDMTSAIDIFLRQAVQQHSIPFTVTTEPAEFVKKTPQLGGWEGKIQMADDFDAPLELVKKTPKPGCMRGKIWMSDDFDEPLEDFKEYMY